MDPRARIRGVRLLRCQKCAPPRKRASYVWGIQCTIFSVTQVRRSRRLLLQQRAMAAIETSGPSSCAGCLSDTASAASPRATSKSPTYCELWLGPRDVRIPTRCMPAAGSLGSSYYLIAGFAGKTIPYAIFRLWAPQYSAQHKVVAPPSSQLYQQIHNPERTESALRLSVPPPPRAAAYNW